jgi:hypothetical protein
VPSMFSNLRRDVAPSIRVAAEAGDGLKRALLWKTTEPAQVGFGWPTAGDRQGFGENRKGAEDEDPGRI